MDSDTSTQSNVPHSGSAHVPHGAGQRTPADRGATTVDTATTVAELEALRSELSEFYLRPGVVSYFDQAPEIMLVRMQEPHRNWQPAVIIVRQGGDIVCVAPFYLEQRRLPLRLSVYKLDGPRAKLLGLFGRDFVFAPDAEREHCYRAVLEALRGGIIDGDLIHVEVLPEHSGLWQHLSAQRDRRGEGDFWQRESTSKTQMLIRHRLMDTYDGWFMSLKGQERSLFRRKQKKLGKLGEGAVEVREYRSPSEALAFLEAVAVIYPLTWQAKTYGTWPRNTPHEQLLVTQAAEMGWMRGFVLFLGEKPIAFEWGYQYCGVYEGQETGYDSDYSKHSPGFVLLHRFIEALYGDDPPQFIDWGFGDSEYKRRLSNDECAVHSLYLLAPSRWLALVELQRAANVLYRQGRALAERMKIDTHLRKWIKRR